MFILFIQRIQALVRFEDDFDMAGSYRAIVKEEIEDLQRA
jgi:hypothetical protein